VVPNGAAGGAVRGERRIERAGVRLVAGVDEDPAARGGAAAAGRNNQDERE
jgi:hypothetical protein